MLFRIDDVSPNTDLPELALMVTAIRERFPKAEIWYCVNLISRTSDGSVYPNAPFKNNSKEFFYNVDSLMNLKDLYSLKLTGKLVSHGLIHADHSQLQYDAQEVSIATSCNLLKTDIFVPPFNRFNQTTESVCRINGIRLVKSDEEGFKSLEHEEFTSEHSHWYFHPWRWSGETFAKKISSKLGLIQGHAVHGS